MRHGPSVKKGSGPAHWKASQYVSSGWRKRMSYFEAQLQNLISVQKTKNGKRLAIKDPDHDLVVKYEKIVRDNEFFLAELQGTFDTIEMTPPIESVLEEEMEKIVAKKLTAD